MPADYSPGIAGERREQVELLRCQFERVAADCDATASLVELELTDVDRRVNGAALRTPCHRTDPRDQLTNAERLDDVIVGAKLQADDSVHLFPPCGDHDDRHVGTRP